MDRIETPPSLVSGVTGGLGGVVRGSNDSFQENPEDHVFRNELLILM